MQLTGIHHLTAVTANARQNHAFYTKTLGLRLVKKTVNQDDPSVYHLFYADGLGSPGTDLTFFEWDLPRERRGTRSIVRTGLRVAGAESLKFWSQRLRDAGAGHGEIVQRDGRATIDFEDPEGQRLSLVADDNDRAAAHPWDKSPVPAVHQIRGLGPITISVPRLEPTDDLLTRAMQMRRAREYTMRDSAGGDASANVHVYEMGDAGPAAELHVALEPDLRSANLGAGGVHHVAFRVPTFDDYDRWFERLNEMGVRSSGPVDRFYFRSLYFREPSGILFELATDGPGFAADESPEHLGERLALPPFLESKRRQIEAVLKPL
jgi:glyoxalase family protein